MSFPRNIFFGRTPGSVTSRSIRDKHPIHVSDKLETFHPSRSTANLDKINNKERKVDEVVVIREKKEKSTTIEIERDNSVSEIRRSSNVVDLPFVKSDITEEPISRTWRVKKKRRISLESWKPD